MKIQDTVSWFLTFFGAFALLRSVRLGFMVYCNKMRLGCFSVFGQIHHRSVVISSCGLINKLPTPASLLPKKPILINASAFTVGHVDAVRRYSDDSMVAYSRETNCDSVCSLNIMMLFMLTMLCSLSMYWGRYAKDRLNRMLVVNGITMAMMASLYYLVVAKCASAWGQERSLEWSWHVGIHQFFVDRAVNPEQCGEAYDVGMHDHQYWFFLSLLPFAYHNVMSIVAMLMPAAQPPQASHQLAVKCGVGPQ